MKFLEAGAALPSQEGGPQIAVIGQALEAQPQLAVENSIAALLVEIDLLL